MPIPSSRFPQALTAVLIAGLAAGCANTALVTGSTGTAPVASAEKPAKRGTPVVPGREARMYVMAGFKEKDCTPLVPDVKIQTQPAKGTVSFKANQTTTVQFSNSGKCLGKQISGTGIYYTAKAGESGSDSFTIIAQAGTGAPMTKTFQVKIAEE